MPMKLAFALLFGFSLSVHAQDVQIVVDAEPAVAGVAVAGDIVVMVNDVVQGDPATSRSIVYVRVESALIRRLCKLSEDQEKSLAELNEAWVKKHSDAAAKPAVNLLGNLLGGAAIQPAVSTVTPVNRIQKLYKTEVTKILTAEQLASYEAEVKARQEFRCRANAECVVAMLERKLALSDEQRDGLSKELIKWKGVADLYTAFYFQNDNFFPNIPRSVLQKHLTADQMGVVNSMQTVQFHREQIQDGPEIVIRR